ncbi:MAG TPA: PrsW family glutamic-type intramembrane protease [Symbiobacteriaceae bacterium]|jgi:hypothetical protein|nr:PrsW family glutamic-type intramembrane protease [Symbiobacteriaceae bacterium]
MSLFFIFLALGPSMIWMYWIWRRDKYQREPLGLVALLFFVGGLIAVVGTLSAVGLYEGYVPSEAASPIVNMLLTAALPEEFFKLLPVLLFAWRSRHWDEPFDGIVYAGATPRSSTPWPARCRWRPRSAGTATGRTRSTPRSATPAAPRWAASRRSSTGRQLARGGRPVLVQDISVGLGPGA